MISAIIILIILGLIDLMLFVACFELVSWYSDKESCKFKDCDREEYPCVYCINEDKMWQPKDEPQTERTTTEQLTEQLTEQPQTDCPWRQQ